MWVFGWDQRLEMENLFVHITCTNSAKALLKWHRMLFISIECMILWPRKSESRLHIAHFNLFFDNFEGADAMRENKLHVFNKISNEIECKKEIQILDTLGLHHEERSSVATWCETVPRAICEHIEPSAALRLYIVRRRPFSVLRKLFFICRTYRPSFFFPRPTIQSPIEHLPSNLFPSTNTIVRSASYFRTQALSFITLKFRALWCDCECAMCVCTAFTKSKQKLLLNRKVFKHNNIRSVSTSIFDFSISCDVPVFVWCALLVLLNLLTWYTVAAAIQYIVAKENNTNSMLLGIDGEMVKPMCSHHPHTHKHNTLMRYVNSAQH